MVTRQDLFGDGSAYIEYYAGKKVAIGTKFGLKIVIKVPDKMSDINETNKLINVSTNCTVGMSMSDLQLFNKCIARGIQIVTADRQAMDNGITLQEEKTKNIPSKDIDHKSIYLDAKGHKWIYLGHGKIYSNRQSYPENRSGCYEIYATMDREDLNTLQIDSDGRLHNASNHCHMMIDSYSTKKKFIKKIHSFPRDVIGYVDQWETLTFVPQGGK